MSGRLGLAAQLIQDEEFDIAKQMLINKVDDPLSLYFLSLLHRYHDEYEQEKDILNRIKNMDIDQTYIQERLKWHARPLFDPDLENSQLVPRKIVSSAGIEPPSQEILEQLCIVFNLGATDPNNQVYFNCAIQMIESFKHTVFYKDIPIFVIDCGMTGEQKEYLINKKLVQEIKPFEPAFCGLDFGNQKLSPHEKTLYSRYYLNYYFPQYRYCLNPEVDVWIQDENCLHRYVHLGVRQGFSCWLSKHNCGTNLRHRFLQQPLGIQEVIKDKFFAHIAIVLFDSFNPLIKDLQYAMGLQYKKNGLSADTYDEWAATYAVYKNSLGCLTENVDHFTPYVPIYVKAEDPSVLLTPEFEKIGLIHLPQQLKNNFLYQVTCIKGEREYKTTASAHFRTWPWMDKSDILKKLIHESQVCL